MTNYDLEIYEHLVGYPDDISGLLAYSLYISEKKTWMGKYKSEHGGSSPILRDVKTFHQLSMNHLSRYKQEGESMRKRLIDEQLLNEKDTCIQNIDELLFSALNEYKKRNRKKDFWTNVISSIVSTLVCSMFPFLLAFVCFLICPEITIEMLNRIVPIHTVQTKSTFNEDSKHDDIKTFGGDNQTISPPVKEENDDVVMRELFDCCISPSNAHTTSASAPHHLQIRTGTCGG